MIASIARTSAAVSLSMTDHRPCSPMQNVRCNEIARCALPTGCAQEDTVPSGGPGDLIDFEFRPLKPFAQRGNRVRHEPFVYFDDIKDWVFRVDPLEIIDDLPDR